MTDEEPIPVFERGDVVYGADPFKSTGAGRPWLVLSNSEGHPFHGEQYIALTLTSKSWMNGLILSNTFNTATGVQTAMSNQGRPKEKDIAELRDEYPSGLRVLLQNESVGYMLDALMDMPGTQFNKSMLAETAGVSRQSVHTHIALLTNLGIVREIDTSDTVEYTLDEDAEIVRLLYRLDGVIHSQLNPKVAE